MRRARSSINAVSSRLSNNKIPQEFDGFHAVGWVQDAHGLKGELFVRFFTFPDWLENADEICLLTTDDSSPQPFALTKCNPHKNGYIVALEDVKNRNQSEALVKAQIYIDEELLVSEPGERVFLKQILDFTVMDPAGKALGVIVGFSSNGPQDLLRVRVSENGREALIPLVDPFIVNIDFDKQHLVLDLPQGLLSPEDE